MAPSKSKKQARTMRAACHDSAFAKKMNIPQSVACEFVEADKRTAKKKKRVKKRSRKKGGR